MRKYVEGKRRYTRKNEDKPRCRENCPGTDAMKPAQGRSAIERLGIASDGMVLQMSYRCLRDWRWTKQPHVDFACHDKENPPLQRLITCLHRSALEAQSTQPKECHGPSRHPFELSCRLQRLMSKAQTLHGKSGKQCPTKKNSTLGEPSSLLETCVEVSPSMSDCSRRILV